MHQPSYPFSHAHIARYIFTSIGKVRIEKVVEFSHTSIADLYNVGFGDLLPDGSIDDLANTNNGDIIKVLATVVQTI